MREEAYEIMEYFKETSMKKCCCSCGSHKKMFERETMILDEIIRKTKEDLELENKPILMDWLGRSLAQPFRVL